MAGLPHTGRRAYSSGRGEAAMKIARIETFLFDPGAAKNLLFCRVETENGLHGWGEAYVTPGKEPVIEHLLRDRNRDVGHRCEKCQPAIVQYPRRRLPRTGEGLCQRLVQRHRQYRKKP